VVRYAQVYTIDEGVAYGLRMQNMGKCIVRVQMRWNNVTVVMVDSEGWILLRIDSQVSLVYNRKKKGTGAVVYKGATV
jgi:hypothetical protein